MAICQTNTTPAKDITIKGRPSINTEHALCVGPHLAIGASFYAHMRHKGLLAISTRTKSGEWGWEERRQRRSRVCHWWYRTHCCSDWQINIWPVTAQRRALLQEKKSCLKDILNPSKRKKNKKMLELHSKASMLPKWKCKYLAILDTSAAIHDMTGVQSLYTGYWR